MTFINGVLFASTTALAGVLCIIVFLRWIMSLDAGLDQAVVQGSLPLGELCRDIVIFGVLAVIAGVTFWGEIKRRDWHGWAEFLLLFGLIACLIFFLAEAPNRLRDLGLLTGVWMFCGAAWLALRVSGLLRRILIWLGEGN
ncbi:MAG TPA: hypothetical protein VFX47_03930 [Gammaproteobacteria bacterium]|nr:hypothetical protein [Gammaproteobacteria bacterium]